MAADFDWADRTVAGETISIALRVPEDLKYLEGHFPGDPIVPGVAQLVAIAEAAIAREFPDLGPPTGVRQLKFMSALRPGDSLTLLLRRRDSSVEVSIMRGDTECTSAVIAFAPAP